MPGAISEGDTRQEALANIAEAMSLWLEVAQEHGEGPLTESTNLVAAKIVTVLGFRAEEGWTMEVETTLVDVQVPVAV
jgi:hypothetical protein